MYLIVRMIKPDGITVVDTLQYQMANPDGSLLGDGFTDVKESKLYYRDNFVFKNAGNYQIEIEHAVRANGKINGDSLLSGVSDVGFRIENAN